MRHADDRPDPWSYTLRPVFAMIVVTLALGIGGFVVYAWLWLKPSPSQPSPPQPSCRCSGDAAAVALAKRIVDAGGGTTRWTTATTLAWRSPDGAEQWWYRARDNYRIDVGNVIVVHPGQDSEWKVFDASRTEFKIKDQTRDVRGRASEALFYRHALVAFLPYLLCDEQSQLQALEPQSNSDGRVRILWRGGHVYIAGLESCVVTIDPARNAILELELRGTETQVIRFSGWQSVNGLYQPVIEGFGGSEYQAQALDDVPPQLLYVGRM